MHRILQLFDIILCHTNFCFAFQHLNNLLHQQKVTRKYEQLQVNIYTSKMAFCQTISLWELKEKDFQLTTIQQSLPILPVKTIKSNRTRKKTSILLLLTVNKTQWLSAQQTNKPTTQEELTGWFQAEEGNENTISLLLVRKGWPKWQGGLDNMTNT